MSPFDVPHPNSSMQGSDVAHTPHTIAFKTFKNVNEESTMYATATNAAILSLAP